MLLSAIKNRFGVILVYCEAFYSKHVQMLIDTELLAQPIADYRLPITR